MRPRKEENKKRNIQFKVYLTIEEKQILQEEFTKERFTFLSDFARNRLLKKRLVKHLTVSEDYFNVFRSLDYQLAKIGNNLNQIAYKLNAYSAYMLNDDDKKVLQGCYKLHKACLETLVKYLKVIKL